MRNRIRAVSTLVVATVALLAACADGGKSFSTAPDRASGSGAHALLDGATGTLTNLLIAPVTRDAPLASDISWSFTVGPAGGSSGNSTAGLAIWVPAGALSSTQTITVTALAGSPVAYKFEPHGLVFSRKVALTQNLRGTSAALLSLPLSGAYFATDELELTDDGLAKVTEIIAALANPWTRTATFPIQHFSGYILASGRSSSEEAGAEQ